MSSFDSERSTTEEEINSTIQLHTPVISSISEALQKVILHNESQEYYHKIVQHQMKSPFSTWQVPSISIEDYLERIKFYTKCEEASLISALIYIDRISSIGHIVLTSYNVHRILFCSILAGIKYNEDTYFKNDYYATVAGITEKELNKLEYLYMNAIKYTLYIDEEEYSQYMNYLLNSK